MSSLDVVRRLHQHRAWVNEKLVAAAEKLDADALQRPLAIGQGSLWRSLMHMYGAEYVWLEVLSGHESAVLSGDLPDQLPGNQAGEGGITTLADLKSRWIALEAHWRDYLQPLSEAQLDDLVWRISTYGPRRATRRLDVLLHVCTHAHYTATQTINMLRQLGASELPDPMLITLAREELTEKRG